MPYGVAKNLKHYLWEFPGGLMVRIPGFHCHGSSSVSGQGTEIPQAAWHDQKKKKKNTQTKQNAKCTVFAEEIMTTTQLAIKNYVLWANSFPGEDPAAPGLRSYPLPRGGGGFGE